MATDSRGENVRVAVLGTGIMGSAMAAIWFPPGCAPRSGIGRPRRPRRCPRPERW